jgi:CBS domain-containing protein
MIRCGWITGCWCLQAEGYAVEAGVKDPLLRVAESPRRQRSATMKVENYMQPKPLTVKRGETVQRIAELIRKHGVRQIPVVDGHNRLVGIVTDRDIRSATGPTANEEFQLVAEDVMTQDVVTTFPGAELATAVDELYQHGFGALPVVVGEQVVGLLSTHELLGWMKEKLEEGAAKAAARSLETYTADIL